MGNIALWIYLSEVVDNLGNLLVGGAVAIFVVITVLLIFIGIAFINDDLTEDMSKKTGKWLRCLTIALLIFAPLAAAVPNQKTIAAMIVVPAIVNNEDISGLTKDSLKGLRILAADWLKEVTKDAEDNN